MVLQVISRGMKHRKMGSHELNLESSRSHSIMTVYIDAVTTSPEEHDYGIPKFGKVSFVDLAGSERLKDTKSAGEMLKETANINKSLFTLGKVCLRLPRVPTSNSPQDPLLDPTRWLRANQHYQCQTIFGSHIAMLLVFVCQVPLASVLQRLPAVLWRAGCPMLCCAEHSAYSMA